MNTRSRADRKYLDDLFVHLRMRDVPGPRIGEILAEAEAHADATGEPLAEAFGAPKEYAAQWERGTPTGLRRWLPDLPGIVLNGVGGCALASGAYAIGSGGSAFFDLPALVVALVGMGLVLVGIATVRVDRVVDPRSGEPITWSRRTIMLMSAAGYGAIVVVVAAAGAVQRVLIP